MSDSDSKTAFGKAVAAWAGVGFSKWLTAIGVTSWGDFSALCASVLSLLLIANEIWKWYKRWRSN